MKNFENKVVVVTGGASGIGRGLVERFSQSGARVVVSDRNEAAAREVAASVGGISVATDVGVETDMARLVDVTLKQHGRIDLFVSNAGIAFNGALDTPLEKWRQIYDVNVLAHVYAAKYALPSMLERGEGYFLNVSSAAGILVEFDALPYTVSKHAAFGFSEWLAVTYRARGIRVSVLAPAGVRTPMAASSPSILKNAISVDELVDTTLEGLAAERFLISTHPFVSKLLRLKGTDYDEYLRVMEQRRAEYAEAERAAGVHTGHG